MNNQFLVRIIFYSVDPHQLKGIYPRNLRWMSSFFWNLSLAFLILSVFVLIFYWLQLAQKNNVINIDHPKLISALIWVGIIIGSLATFPLVIYVGK